MPWGADLKDLPAGADGRLIREEADGMEANGRFAISEGLLGEDWFRLWLEDITRAVNIVGVTSWWGFVKIEESPELLENLWMPEESIGLDFMQLDPIYWIRFEFLE